MNSVPSTAQHSTAQHSTAQHSTAQHSTAQHSTAQHSTAQHSTAQPYLAEESPCRNRHCERAIAKCGNPVFFRAQSEEHRAQGIVLAGESYRFNKLSKLASDYFFRTYGIGSRVLKLPLEGKWFRRNRKGDLTRNNHCSWHNRHCETASHTSLRAVADCVAIQRYSVQSEEHRAQGIVLAGESYRFNKLSKPALDCALTNYYSKSSFLPSFLKGDVCQRLTGGFLLNLFSNSVGELC